MNVARILATKGSDVVTVRPHDTLTTVAAVIAERRIGAVVVTSPSGLLLGIISERDIVRALVSRGGAALDDLVSDHMTSDVVTGTPEETITDVMERMTRGRFRHLPVVKDGALGGIISIGDVVKQRLAEIETEANAMRAYIASA